MSTLKTKPAFSTGNLQILITVPLVVICAAATFFALQKFFPEQIKKIQKLKTEDSRHKDQETHSADLLLNSEKQKQKQSPAETHTLGEWQSFAVYHPDAGISDDSAFASVNGQSGEKSNSVNEESPKNPKSADGKLILGGRSLISLLRSAFGDQPRAASAAEGHPWFIARPTALFSAEEIPTLCSDDSEFYEDEKNAICWRAELNAAYLDALGNFAEDACPQLVQREMEQKKLEINKFVRSADFNRRNVAYFALHGLLIPAHAVSEAWVTKITETSKNRLKDYLESEKSSDTNQAVQTEGLYSFACQEMLRSPEFYTR